MWITQNIFYLKNILIPSKTRGNLFSNRWRTETNERNDNRANKSDH